MTTIQAVLHTEDLTLPLGPEAIAAFCDADHWTRASADPRYQYRASVTLEPTDD